MLVHFIGSKGDIKKDIAQYREIISIITGLGCELSREWVEQAYEFSMNKGIAEDLDWKKIGKENMEALALADVVIADATTKSFATGYQTAVAIQQKKPTLVLSKDDGLLGTFGSGIESDFVRVKIYNRNNLKDIITDFINENTIDVKDMRFNFFIDRQINNYLRWASYTYGKTKAEVLRDLVKKEIEKQG